MFVLSEDGTHNVLKMNIEDGSVEYEILKSFNTALSSIYRCDDTYYIAVGGNSIYKFTETTDPELVVSGLPGYITGLWVSGNSIYFVSNFGHGFYVYNMETKEFSKKFDLNNPYLLYRISF